MKNLQESVTDILAGIGAKEINFHYPCNMVNAIVVSYKYMKESLSFVINRVETKVDDDSLYKFVQTRFDLSLGSKYNLCQPTSIDPITPKPQKTAT